MTDDERQKIESETLAEYSSCLRTRNCLKGRLESIGEKLKKLGWDLVQHPEQVMISDKRTAVMAGGKEVEFELVEIIGLLKEFNDCTREKVRLEGSLKTSEHSHMIRQ